MDKILDTINDPKILHNFTLDQLEQLAAELREYIVTTVAETGGHLAPSLGVVDLTLALYSTFNFPVDKLVWDVGHQAYAHKILTGRRDDFKKLRQKGGITGFPRRAESVYDAFGVGHASTSISAALGMAIARDLSGRGENIIAVIGDGALTGGEAFEALNNAGDLSKDLIVILNDNGMSIDGNVGAVSEYLSRIRITPQYNKAKKDIEGLFKSIPSIGDKVLKTAGYIKDGVKSVLVPGSLFEEMGFKYIGPIDGHNISLMQEVFREIRQLDGPILVHVRTKKGRGYLPAEIEPERFHGIGKFDIATGNSVAKNVTALSYTSVFSKALIDLADINSNIVAITAAMPSGTGLKNFSETYPNRYFDVGIAEEHAVTMAAGMAAAGKHPVVAIYSTFLQRAYDQILHDICLQNLPVTLCLDRAGLVGEDGATHHGVFDLSYLRNIPNLTVMAPKDENELRQMLGTAVKMNTPTAIRYPRGAGIGAEISSKFENITVGESETLVKDGKIAFLAIGSMVDVASKASIILSGDGIASSVVNMRFIKPLDTKLLKEMAVNMELLVTLEENVLAGGFGSAVLEWMADNKFHTPVIRIGIPDNFIEQGTKHQLFEECGLLPEQIAEKVKMFYYNKD